jgi:guanylate kinase
VAGQIFIITAPSGTGKTTLLKPLLAADPRLRFSISYTTRRPRPEEVHGRDYFFITAQEFHRLRDERALVEWVEQFGYGYGTSREWVTQTLNEGTDLVFDLDPRGARALKVGFPQATLIFILPPNLEELERRLQSRGNLDPGELARRLEQGREELREASWYDYLIVNDQLPVALEQLRAIITAARCRTSCVWPQLAPCFFPSEK